MIRQGMEVEAEVSLTDAAHGNLTKRISVLFFFYHTKGNDSRELGSRVVHCRDTLSLNSPSQLLRGGDG